MCVYGVCVHVSCVGRFVCVDVCIYVCFVYVGTSMFGSPCEHVFFFACAHSRECIRYQVILVRPFHGWDYLVRSVLRLCGAPPSRRLA